MPKLDVNIINVEERIIYGLSKNSNDRTMSKDINELSKKYRTINISDNVLPYFVLSKNYDAKTGNFELFVGSSVNDDRLSKLVLPAGKYAVITIKPKLGFLWGLSIGEAKRYFYTKWVKENNINGKNLEYEYHTEKSIQKKPTIDIIFAIE